MRYLERTIPSRVMDAASNQPLLAAHASECRAETDFRRAPGSPPHTLARWGGERRRRHRGMTDGDLECS